MVTEGRAGRPLNDLFADYPPATKEDVAAAARQGSDLGRDKDRNAQLWELYQELTAGRREREEFLRSPTPARLAFFVDESQLPLLTIDELLVRTADYRTDDGRRVPMRKLLAPFELDEPDTVAQLDDRVTRLRKAGLETQRLATIGTLLRRHGYQATMNQCHPLGYVVKSVFGEVGPEPTTRETLPRWPGHDLPNGWAELQLAVLDTGIVEVAGDTGGDRSDGWLTSIARDPKGPKESNIDGLYDAGPPVFYPGAGHGTFVAGVVEQVNPYVTINVLRVLADGGIGSDVEVAIGILEAVDRGARVLNLSLGTETDDDQPPLATLVALELIAERKLETDVVLVAAAGNNRNTRPVWPAAFCTIPTPGVRVVSVAALNEDKTPADFSTHGFWITFSTIGRGVLSPFVLGEETPTMDPQPDSWTTENPWAIWTGTSFAAPQIAGLIARYSQENGVSPSDAVAWLLGQGVWVPDYGRAVVVLPGG